MSTRRNKFLKRDSNEPGISCKTFFKTKPDGGDPAERNQRAGLGIDEIDN